MERVKKETYKYYIFNFNKDAIYDLYKVDDIIEILKIKKFPEHTFFLIGFGALLYIGGRVNINNFKSKYLYKLKFTEKLKEYKYFFYINILNKDDYYHLVWKREQEKKKK